jgi:hypothetical protein
MSEWMMDEEERNREFVELLTGGRSPYSTCDEYWIDMSDYGYYDDYDDYDDIY